MCAKAGGSENLGFLSVDYKNYLQSRRMRSMMLGDVGCILEYLEKMLVNDSGSIYKMQLTRDDKMINIFGQIKKW